MGQDQRRSVAYSQNFLKRAGLARQLVAKSTIEPGDLVVEIGPGNGILTRELARRCRQVLAIEKDPDLASRLSRSVGPAANVVIFEADALDLPLPLTPYKVFANIPFNITAAIVARLTGAPNPPDEAWIGIQREAAGRFAGEPRTTLASLLLKPWFSLSIVHWFRNTDFVPPPRVEVVLLRFSKRGPPLVPPEERQLYRDFVTHGFTAWRPTVRDAYREVFTARQLAGLAGGEGLDLDRKPSAMPFEQWLVLYRHFAVNSTERQRAIVAGAEKRLREQQAKLDKEHRTRARARSNPYRGSG